MRIYNADTDTKANKVTLFLTSDEALEMKDALELLLKNENHHHEHVPNSNFTKEVTLCIYRKENISSFDDRSKKLILDDE